MRPWTLHDGYCKSAKYVLLALSCAALFVGRSSGQEQEDQAAFRTVPKAVCGANDHPETALQGQVPAALRATGFQGFNCNLQLVGQSRGDGANWQTTEFRDAEATWVYRSSTSQRLTNRRRPAI